MSKKKKPTKSQKKSAKVYAMAQSNPIRRFFSDHPNFLPLVILFVLLLIFFNDVMFEGKTLLPPDTINAKSIIPFKEDAFNRGIYPLWNPYLFCGMPSFASLQRTDHVDLFGLLPYSVYWILEKFFPIPEFTRALFEYLLFGIFIYILLMRRTKGRIVALLAAVAMIFQPQVIAFIAFGHSSKLTTMVLIPIIFLSLDEFLQKRQMHYFALLALSVGLQLLRGHTQVAYYTFMMIGLFILYWLIESICQKQAFQNIAKTLGAVVLALIIGAAMSSWLYLSVQEYAHYSIRGGTTGLDYSYATNWSFSPLEISTFFVPSFLGFGGQTYWGAMPFTDYPLYMGIVTLLLAGMALILKRDRYVIFFTILALVALIVSFGKHLPILYGPLFKFLPFFNKFRVPTMIHILLEFAVVILAGLGLQALLNLNDPSVQQKLRKYIYVFVGVCGAFGLFLLIGKSAYLGMVAGSAKQLSASAQALAYKKAASDGLKLIIILAVTGFSIIYFLRGKIKANTLGGILIALLLLDLWWVDFKIIAPKPKADEGKYFAENNAVQFLKKDPAPYRIFPVYDDKPDNWYMYHKIQNIRGYHAAKLKIYQTFLENTGLDQRDRYGFPPFLSKYLKVQFSNGQPSLQVIPLAQIPPARLQSDNAIMDMLNVKYLISYYPIPDPRYQTVLQNKPMVIENTRVLPRAFFVDKIKVISNKDEFFNYLKSGNFDPAKEAILEVEPRFDIEPSTNNRVQITSYDIHEIKLEAQVEKPALMVLSEIYYPAGWKAFVDGKESRIYKTNYILRSILLQPGSQEIKFVFNPKTFKLGLGITFILFIPLVVFCLDSLRRGKFTNRSRR